MKLILIFIFSLSTFSFAEDSEEVKACREEIDRAKDKVRDYAHDMQRQAMSTAYVQPPMQQQQQMQPGQAGQQQSTGNPLTDAINQMGQINQQRAQAEQQALDQQAQIEDDCFKQATEIEDKMHEFRKEDYSRRKEVEIAENELRREQSKLRVACDQQAQELYAKELESLASYQRRIVSTVGGATSSQNKIRARRDQLYMDCTSSLATREGFATAKSDLNTKLTNFQIETERIMADLAYMDKRTGDLDAHCALRQQRLEQKTKRMMAQLEQQQTMAMMGMAFAMSSGAMNSASQGQAGNSYEGANHMLQPANWELIEKACLNAGLSSTDTYEGIPQDIYPIFNAVNEKCSPKGTSKKCVGSSGRNSVESQNLRRSPILQNQ